MKKSRTIGMCHADVVILLQCYLLIAYRPNIRTLEEIGRPSGANIFYYATPGLPPLGKSGPSGTPRPGLFSLPPSREEEAQFQMFVVPFRAFHSSKM
jgi:hypothetical protein